MTNHNIKEYELIRQEMESLKDRLTKHMSFAIGSSGLLFLAIQTVDIKTQDNLTISMICIFTALIITAFFYLSIYKYNSLNRYAGYCKLINLEVRLFRMNVNSKSLEEKPILKAPSPKNQKKEPMSLLVLMVSKNILLMKTEVHSFLPRREQGKHIF